MKILHLEDNRGDADLVREILTSEFPACTITLVESRDRFLTALTAEPAPDLIISDFALPAFDGLTALALAREHAAHIPFIFASGSIGEERAITSIRSGAYDYVLKDNMARLPMVIRRALADSAQRRHHEEDDRRLRELAGIIERAAEAIVVTDLQGRITLWNHGAAQLYGVPSAETIGRSAEELLPPTMREPLRAAHETVLETGAWRGDLAVTTRDGRDIVVDLHMTLVRDEAGQPSARLTLATDVTEKKKLEEQFLRAQRLDSLGLLAAGIAHDLNNVLAPVLMSAPILRQHATLPSDLRVLDILEKSAERGSALVRQILGFALGASGGFRPTQVKHLLRDVTDVIQASFPKSIILDENVAADLWPIEANPTQIHQILLNLAVNARDAMLPRGGTLRICATNEVIEPATARAIDGARPGSFIVLEVGDAGTGITPEVLTRIWEPFFTTKGEGKGTGLGLSTVRGIAAAHKGFVTLETRVGRGTTFRVYLPAEKPVDSRSERVVRPELPRGHDELVLLVDDEVEVRDVTASTLTHHGYTVINCGDGVEAIGLFMEKGAAIQLVITDINMPRLDGAALALVLRRLRPDVRILAITGLGSARGVAKEQPEAETFDAKLYKPFTVESLITAVHQTLHGNRRPAGS